MKSMWSLAAFCALFFCLFVSYLWEWFVGNSIGPGAMQLLSEGLQMNSALLYLALQGASLFLFLFSECIYLFYSILFVCLLLLWLFHWMLLSRIFILCIPLFPTENRIDDEGARYLSEGLKGNSKLLFLYLGGMSVSFCSIDITLWFVPIVSDLKKFLGLHVGFFFFFFEERFYTIRICPLVYML